MPCRAKRRTIYQLCSAFFAAALIYPLACLADDKKDEKPPTAQEAKAFWKDMDDEGNGGQQGKHASSVMSDDDLKEKDKYQNEYIKARRNIMVEGITPCLIMEKSGNDGAQVSGGVWKKGIEFLSKLQLAIMKDHFHDDKGEIDFTKVQSAFEMFANGELRGGENKAGQREMDKLVNWLEWMCFAKIAIARRVDKSQWEEIIKILEKSKQIYIDVYNKDLVKKLAEAKEKDVQESDKANVIQAGIFDPKKQYDEKKKVALRKKIHAMTMKDISEEFQKEVKEYIAYYVPPSFPGAPSDGGKTYAVSFVDSGESCTFGRTEPVVTVLTSTDDKFNPLSADRVATTTPNIPIAPIAPASPTVDKPVETAETPVEEPKGLAEPPKKPEQPTVTENPAEKPPTTDNESTPTGDIVILFKGNQAVLEQGQTGEALKGEHVMLVFSKPDAPGTRNAVKDDSGFDKDGVQGVTGLDGAAKLTVRAEDRGLFLLSFGAKPSKYYRIDTNAMKNTGSVGEVARNAKPNFSEAAPNGGKIAAETFKIGDRTFVRRLYVAPYNATVVMLSGDKVDWCRVIEPASGLGAEPDNPSVLHREVPEAALHLAKRGLKR